MTIKVAVVGATGRMGKLALDLINSAQDMSLHASLHSRSSLSELDGADVVLDVTKLEVSEKVVAQCIEHGLPIVVGTSGWSSAKLSQLAAEVSKFDATAVVVPNFSIGSMLATRFSAEAAKHFASVEIVEAHHKHKVDAPSGTAIGMGEVIAKALGKELKDCAVYAREGHTGEREEGTIGFATIRGGDIVGDHTVMFCGDGERIEVTHKSASRMSYAQGSVRAGRFLAKQANGLFDMQDVLGLKQIKI
jgi:4-hydroxy-tetrahydrodipicolinate reductase